jgi:hypothetical protein
MIQGGAATAILSVVSEATAVAKTMTRSACHQLPVQSAQVERCLRIYLLQSVMHCKPYSIPRVEPVGVTVKISALTHVGVILVYPGLPVVVKVEGCAASAQQWQSLQARRTCPKYTWVTTTSLGASLNR